MPAINFQKRFVHMIKSIYWKSYISLLSLRAMPRINLGDYVIYLGKRYVAIQGVRHPIWTIVRGTHGSSGYERLELHQDDFRKSLTPRNLISSYRNRKSFYMNSWFDIWMREGIKPWMRGCRIWGKD